MFKLNYLLSNKRMEMITLLGLIPLKHSQEDLGMIISPVVMAVTLMSLSAVMGVTLLKIMDLAIRISCA